MTLLSDIARDLSLGHLADLPAFGIADGVIEPSQQTKLLLRTNDALRAIYTRFPLQVRTLVIEAVDGMHLYPLRQEFALTSGSAEPVKFIKDSVAEPFLEDVLGIEHVYDGEHCELALNDREDPTSLHTPAFDVLQIDKPVTGDRYHVEYRALHAAVPMETTDLSTVRLRVPAALLTAFKALIAAGIHEGAGNEGSMAKAAGLAAIYEAECARLEHANTLNHSMVDTNTKPQRGGWI